LGVKIVERNGKFPTFFPQKTEISTENVTIRDEEAQKEKILV